MLDLDQIRMSLLPNDDRKLLERVLQQEEISHAGRELRRLRSEAKNRPARHFTGYIGRRKAWFGQRVVLTNNAVGTILAVHRGHAAVSWTDPFAVQPNKVTAIEVASIRAFRHPAAVALGKLKAGRREVTSPLKAIKARLNGCRPVRPGSRPRGRPPKRSLNSSPVPLSVTATSAAAHRLVARRTGEQTFGTAGFKA